MINFTNNNIKKCLDYQLEYYTLIKEKINNLNKSVEQYKSIQKKIKIHLFFRLNISEIR